MLATLRILKWNKVPISEPYKHIPREYEEVKNYICDLITKDWIKKSLMPCAQSYVMRL